MKNLRILLAAALAFLPFNEASAAVVQIQAKDSGGTARSFNVTTNTDITGNLSWNNVICDQGTGATCASVGTAGAPSTNALTVQPVTLGNGTSANAARVTLSNDSTGQVNAIQSGTWNIGTVTTLPALPANQSVNVNQIGGVAVLTGTGATGTGAQRITVSTDQATNAGAALVKGGVGVVNGGSTYQHVAASQTAAVLQTSTGAIGDYLSHCVIYPSTTGAGSVTVFDNTNAAATNVIEFTTGTLSNLAPIAIPVGAVSTAGAWKVTTGASETVVCYGKFS